MLQQCWYVCRHSKETVVMLGLCKPSSVEPQRLQPFNCPSMGEATSPSKCGASRLFVASAMLHCQAYATSRVHKLKHHQCFLLNRFALPIINNSTASPGSAYLPRKSAVWMFEHGCIRVMFWCPAHLVSQVPSTDVLQRSRCHAALLQRQVL